VEVEGPFEPRSLGTQWDKEKRKREREKEKTMLKEKGKEEQCCWRRKETGTLAHWRWGLKMLQPLWVTMCWSLKMVNRITVWLSNLIPSIYPKDQEAEIRRIMVWGQHEQNSSRDPTSKITHNTQKGWWSDSSGVTPA
jgi:hypothetical protein